MVKVLRGLHDPLHAVRSAGICQLAHMVMDEHQSSWRSTVGLDKVRCGVVS